MSIAAASLPAEVPGTDEIGPRHPDRIVTLRRVRGMGAFLLALAVIMLVPFGLNVPSALRSTFVLNNVLGAPAISVGDLVQPTRWVSVGLALGCAAAGVLLVARRRPGGAYLVFSLGSVLFLWSFLVWADRGRSINLDSLLEESLLYATPIVYGSLSGVLCERSGVINIGIEGQFLAGAFLGALVASASGDLWLGALSGAAAGALFGWVLAFLALRYGADQIIVGILIDAFALGLTNYLLQQIFTPYPSLNSPNVFRALAIPGLHSIPILGPVVFDQNIVVYGAMVLLVAVNVALFRTRWGLRVRAVGEHPEAAS
ncbi:MAG TPA: hypothetical protein VMD59_04695, partial [Acidimicrobiales bacterium]|nr:hypothetical protein [Acidimicrobiales bacterium]